MGLAGVENLQSACRGRNLLQALRIGEEQIGALVGGCAARKTQREHFGIEHQAGARGNFSEQRFLGASVRCLIPASGRSMALRR